jgi:hypothetical protein
MTVETHTSPPEPDVDDDGDDTPTARLGVHFGRVDGTHMDAAVQLFGDAATDPEQFADAVLSAALALAQLVGPDHGWATVRRLAAYDGTTTR